MSDNGDHGVVGADGDLDQLFAQTRALRELADDPDGSSDADRVYDFSIRWGVLMSGRWPRLAYYSDRGELDASAQERFEALCVELRSALPSAQRLGVAKPRVLPAMMR